MQNKKCKTHSICRTHSTHLFRSALPSGSDVTASTNRRGAPASVGGSLAHKMPSWMCPCCKA
ncbi:hypothetical protein pneo_cds_99 [Pandoravirus neocaledonia]|uniref:Uncharacterized protein n=1 Tax=Pandoravirus neocaledonia TaxID=2107708 RepID=A0A2U7UBB0_9VIRU|nr:hypothetical protein pneo_cds_99 [Pandoravirus neocaledonia]AVK75706.1 hypothetical protein pneo_cds_99 [Pandoravirus neocaledonia]